MFIICNKGQMNVEEGLYPIPAPGFAISNENTVGKMRDTYEENYARFWNTPRGD